MFYLDILQEYNEAVNNLLDIIFSNGFQCLQEFSAEYFRIALKDTWSGSPSIRKLRLNVDHVHHCQHIFHVCPGLRWFKNMSSFISHTTQVSSLPIHFQSNLKYLELNCTHFSSLVAILSYTPNVTTLNISVLSIVPVELNELATILFKSVPKLTIFSCQCKWDEQQRIENETTFKEDIQKLHPLFQKIFLSQELEITAFHYWYECFSSDEPIYHIKIEIKSFKQKHYT